MGVEEILQVAGAAPHLGVEVDAAGSDAALLEDHQHGVGGGVEVCGELVGVPAEQVIAAIGVNAAQLAIGRGELEVVFKGVAGQGGVIGFDVEFELVQQVVFAEEAQDRGGVVVVLVLGRLFGLGLHEQGAGKADCPFCVRRPCARSVRVGPARGPCWC